MGLGLKSAHAAQEHGLVLPQEDPDVLPEPRPEILMFRDLVASRTLHVDF